MLILILFYAILANENNIYSNFKHLNEYMPDNLSREEDIKSFAKKAYKKALVLNKDSQNSTDNTYEIDDEYSIRFKIDTGLLFESLKLKLNSNIANINMTYLAFDNSLNLNVYKDINNELQLSISDENKLSSKYKQILFNFIYKF